LPVWTANNKIASQNSLSWAFSQKIFCTQNNLKTYSKQSMLPPLIGKIKDFCEKAHERPFCVLFAVHTGKDFGKKCENF
jgi:hypothetical protein